MSAALKILATACLAMALMPALAPAQNRPQQGAGGGGGPLGGSGMMGALQQVLKQLDLTADQNAMIRQTLRNAAQDAKDAIAGIQDATPQERVQKLQDAQKIINDARDKVENTLTPQQRSKFYPLMAKTLFAQATDRLKAVQTATAKMDIPDDQRGELKKLFDDDQKTLDDYKTEADAVTDSPGMTSLQLKLSTLQMDNRQQLVDVLGREGMQQLRSAMQGQGQGDQAGQVAAPHSPDASAGGKGLMPSLAPTTQPAAK